MTVTEKRLAEARHNERQARAQWFRTLDEFQSRSTTRGIAGEAWDGIQDGIGAAGERIIASAKKRPGAIAAIGSAITLFVLRKRIADAILKRLDRRKETSPPRYPLKTTAMPAADPTPDLNPQPTMTEEA